MLLIFLVISFIFVFLDGMRNSMPTPQIQKKTKQKKKRNWAKKKKSIETGGKQKKNKDREKKICTNPSILLVQMVPHFFPSLFSSFFSISIFITFLSTPNGLLIFLEIGSFAFTLLFFINFFSGIVLFIVVFHVSLYSITHLLDKESFST